MKTLRTLAIAVTLVFALLGASFAQTALTATTLSAAVNGPTPYGGLTSPLQTYVTLTSVTGVVAPFNTSVYQSYLYVDREAMAVVSYNSSTKVVQVIRGALGTYSSPHLSGAMVLIGQTNSLGQNAFFQQDPVGACNAANTPSTPWVNVISGNQWLCSTVTNHWVPGFGNDIASPQPTTAVASAAGLITPSGPLFHITGTSAITGFNIPVGFDPKNGGSFCVIPDGIFTTTNANNIALASTAVVSKVLCWNYDPNTAKFYPSY